MVEENNPETLYEMPIEILLKYKEDEILDRTRGGQDKIGEKIAGFGTKNGGLLIIGQEDLKKGGEVFGINDDFQKDFAQAISCVKPTPLTQSKILNYKDKKIALIKVKGVGQLRPCAYKKNFYERKSDSTISLQPDEVRQYHVTYGGVNIENLPTHATEKDIDTIELEKYCSLLNKDKKTILESISSDDSLTIRGVIVLCKEPTKYLEGAFLEIQKYDNALGTQPIPIGTSIKLSKPAALLIEEATNIIIQNLPFQRRYEGARMIEESIIPISIIREIITNAVAHRNYRSNEHIRVRIFADCFDISNPAVVTERMWANMVLNHSTYHPNEGIYTFLNPKQLYEGRGEGIWKIKGELERLRRIAPKFMVLGDTPSSFYVKIGLIQNISKDVKMAKLYDMIKKRKVITSSDVIKQLKVSRVTAIRMLNDMVNEGFLNHQGSTKTSRYLVKKENLKLFE